MNILEIIKKFLGLIDTGESNYLDITHIIVASIITVITVFLGVYLGIKNRNKSEKDKTKLILPFSIIMWVLLVLRFIMIVVRGYNFGENGFMNLIEGNLPLFLNPVRNALASGQPRTFQNSATDMREGSVLRAAPIDENNTAPVSRDFSISVILS